jgi:hypothetical protein
MHVPAGPPSAPASKVTQSQPFGQSEATVHARAQACRDDKVAEASAESVTIQ